jgi:PAS domain S-box-containing protein
MTRILLCMRAGHDREHLAEWLREQHEVETASGTLRPDSNFDLCILDAAGLHANREIIAARREAERPVFLPFLLVARRRQVVRNREALLAEVDDVIWAPVARAELDVRIGALLRIRNLARLVQQRYISLANQSAAMVLVVRSGRIQYANEAARTTFPGLSDRAPVTDLIVPRYRELFEEYMRGLSARVRGEPRSGPLPAPTHVEVQLDTDGERWAHASAAPTFEDDDREFLVMMLDVTESKLRERELLFNVLKHAPDANACVTLQEAESQIVITVSDDGPGFDPEATTGGSGFGLFSLRERLRPFDGTVDIRSAPGEGTVITQRVARPREKEEGHEETHLTR